MNRCYSYAMCDRPSPHALLRYSSILRCRRYSHFFLSFWLPTQSHKQNGEHAKHIVLEFKTQHLDRIIVADLYLNTHLLPADHFLSYQNADGSKTVKRFNKTNVDLCHYHVSTESGMAISLKWNRKVILSHILQGKVRGLSRSKVALSTCDGIHGVIHTDNGTFFIHPKDDAQLDGHHMIINQKSIEQNTSHVPHEFMLDDNQIRSIQRRVI